MSALATSSLEGIRLASILNLSVETIFGHILTYGAFKAAGVVLTPQPVPESVAFIGCGGLLTRPKCIYDLDIDIYGSRFAVPMFVVPGQRDELIIRSNVLRPIIQNMESDEKYWELVFSGNTDLESEQFLQLLSCISRPVSPDKVGTVKLRQAVTLRRNAKIADVFTCVAVEDVPIAQGLCKSQNGQTTGPAPSLVAALDLSWQLKDCGLSDLDISGCEVSDEWTKKLAELVLTYLDVFSKDKLDCGEAKEFVHRIHFTDDHPF